MPELPEVETIRQDLAKKILGKKIKDVQVKKVRLIKSNAKKFSSILKNNIIKKIDRRGKLLIVNLEKGACLPEGRIFLLIHLKMTGQLIYRQGKKIIGGGHGLPRLRQGGQGKLEDDKLPSKYTHIIFEFSNGANLFFNDLRQFGYMKIVDQSELEKVLNQFGIEPLDKDYSLKIFKQILGKRKTSIKQVLLNQKLIAGLGNIYADEVCFYAKVKPTRKVSTLTDLEIKNLYQGSKKILKLAIAKRGTTFNDYRDADGNKGSFIKFLKVYGHKGEPCKRCQPKAGAPRAHKSGIIKKIKLGGRGTHYCDKCQK